MDVYADQPIKLLDLLDDGSARISWDQLLKQDQVQCKIANIVHFHNGVSVGKKFITVKSVANGGYRRLITIEVRCDVLIDPPSV